MDKGMFGLKIHILNCGSTVVDEALPLSNRSKNPLAYTGLFRGKKHKIEVPVTAYLIEHPNALILIDTGWDTKIRTDARKYEGFANYFASPGVLPPGQAVTEHLKCLGYMPEDIDYCFLTHMDIDHAGGLQLVRNAKHILTNEKEWIAANKRNVRYRHLLWQDIEIEPIRMIESQMGPTREGFDLLGDGTVNLVALPGHSAGMTGVLVQNNDKFVVIAGDGGYCEESWKLGILPGIVFDKKAEEKTLAWLKKMSEDEKCLGVFATHDREVKTKVIEL